MQYEQFLRQLTYAQVLQTCQVSTYLELLLTCTSRGQEDSQKDDRYTSSVSSSTSRMQGGKEELHADAGGEGGAACSVIDLNALEGEGGAACSVIDLNALEGARPRHPDEINEIMECRIARISLL